MLSLTELSFSQHRSIIMGVAGNPPFEKIRVINSKANEPRGVLDASRLFSRCSLFCCLSCGTTLMVEATKFSEIYSGV